MNILRGKKEIWAASIIYVIARLNFLFDKENEKYITADTICNFFNTKKSTIGNKATQIEDACNLTIGAEGYCSKQITDSFSFYQTPEGLVIPKSMVVNRELIIELAEGEEAEELEKFVENQRNMMEQELKENKERRAEINRKIAEKKKNKNQMNLFDNL
jgi:glycine cleavage system protein P-like pyridoxal-binding family